MALDRAATLRGDSEWVASRLGDPGSRAVLASREGVLLRRAPEPELVRRSLGELAGTGVHIAEPLLLGLEQVATANGGDASGVAGSPTADRPVFAIDLDALPRASAAALTRGADVVGLRAAGALLARSEAGLAAYLTALLNWHRRHHFCSNCGTATGVAEAGYSRRCPSCEAVHFPRTDPVVIMLVESRGRLLLGRHSGWPQRRYSVLAGFVAPGETLEAAVAREVREESGIEVHDPRYVASQPWPFPSSLMLGFEARSEGGEPTARDGELEDVRWFTLDAAREAAQERSSELELPPRVSIARMLIERRLAARP